MPETMAVSGESLPRKLSLNLKTPFFGLKLHVVLLVLVGIILCVAAILALAFLCVYSKRRAKETRNEAQSEEKRVSGSFALMGNEVETGASSKGMVRLESANVDKLGEKGTAVDGGRAGSGGQNSGAGDDAPGRSSSAMTVEEQRRMGWGRWYRLRELEIATCGFAEESVIGEGGYGIVHRGVLDDDSVVAIKRLHNKKGQAELEFKVEVEAIGKVRHKNLVALVGYCVEDSQRILVYEYVDNGNLAQWLHGDVGPISPLTWGIRMKIAVGMAKGLAYLHEGLEPKVVHRDVKASNILLDKKWNPKISDFGLAKLLGSEASHVTTRVMGTFGYVSPEYASTGMLNEWSDVYSFGILLMEIVSGRTPIDYSRPAAEMNLVDWFKGMVASHRGEEIVDPLIAIPPPPRVLKRVLLVCLRCINLDAKQRPKMGHIVHMLETDDFPFRAGFTSEV